MITTTPTSLPRAFAFAVINSSRPDNQRFQSTPWKRRRNNGETSGQLLTIISSRLREAIRPVILRVLQVAMRAASVLIGLKHTVVFGSVISRPLL